MPISTRVAAPVSQQMAFLMPGGSGQFAVAVGFRRLRRLLRAASCSVSCWLDVGLVVMAFLAGDLVEMPLETVGLVFAVPGGWWRAVLGQHGGGRSGDGARPPSTAFQAAGGGGHHRQHRHGDRDQGNEGVVFMHGMLGRAPACSWACGRGRGTWDADLGSV